jgi:hypothetical protein
LNVNRRMNKLLKYKTFRSWQGMKTCFFGESACFPFDCSNCYFGLKEFLQRFVWTSVSLKKKNLKRRSGKSFYLRPMKL